MDKLGMVLHPECANCDQPNRTCSIGECSNPAVSERLYASVKYTAIPTDELEKLRAENARLQMQIMDHENDCAVLPEDRSVTETVNYLRSENQRLKSVVEAAESVYEALNDLYWLTNDLSIEDKDYRKVTNAADALAAYEGVAG